MRARQQQVAAHEAKRAQAESVAQQRRQRRMLRQYVVRQGRVQRLRKQYIEEEKRASSLTRAFNKLLAAAHTEDVADVVAKFEARGVETAKLEEEAEALRAKVSALAKEREALLEGGGDDIGPSRRGLYRDMDEGAEREVEARREEEEERQRSRVAERRAMVGWHACARLYVLLNAFLRAHKSRVLRAKREVEAELARAQPAPAPASSPQSWRPRSMRKSSLHSLRSPSSRGRPAPHRTESMQAPSSESPLAPADDEPPSLPLRGRAFLPTHVPRLRWRRGTTGFELLDALRGKGQSALTAEPTRGGDVDSGSVADRVSLLTRSGERPSGGGGRQGGRSSSDEVSLDTALRQPPDSSPLVLGAALAERVRLLVGLLSHLHWRHRSGQAGPSKPSESSLRLARQEGIDEEVEEVGESDEEESDEEKEEEEGAEETPAAAASSSPAAGASEDGAAAGAASARLQPHPPKGSGGGTRGRSGAPAVRGATTARRGSLGNSAGRRRGRRGRGVPKLPRGVLATGRTYRDVLEAAVEEKVWGRDEGQELRDLEQRRRWRAPRPARAHRASGTLESRRSVGRGAPQATPAPPSQPRAAHPTAAGSGRARSWLKRVRAGKAGQPQEHHTPQPPASAIAERGPDAGKEDGEGGEQEEEEKEDVIAQPEGPSTLGAQTSSWGLLPPGLRGSSAFARYVSATLFDVDLARDPVLEGRVRERESAITRLQANLRVAAARGDGAWSAELDSVPEPAAQEEAVEEEEPGSAQGDGVERTARTPKGRGAPAAQGQTRARKWKRRRRKQRGADATRDGDSGDEDEDEAAAFARSRERMRSSRARHRG